MKTRSAKRDFWNSIPVVILCKTLDILAIWTGMAIFAGLVSMNNF